MFLTTAVIASPFVVYAAWRLLFKGEEEAIDEEPASLQEENSTPQEVQKSFSPPDVLYCMPLDGSDKRFLNPSPATAPGSEEGEEHPCIKAFQEYGVRSLWHMTHVDNVPSILDKGLFSKRQINGNGQVFQDLSDSGVQDRRSRKNETVFGRNLHEYVPLYVSPKNPMMFRLGNEYGSSSLALVEISLDAFLKIPFVFTDGNAASNSTQFFGEAQDVGSLPWEVLHAQYWTNFEDGSRKKCAEVLVLNRIPSEYIVNVHCADRLASQHLSALGVPVQVSPSKFI